MALKTDIEQLDGGRKLPLVEDFYTIQGLQYHIQAGGTAPDANGRLTTRLHPTTGAQGICHGSAHRQIQHPFAHLARRQAGNHGDGEGRRGAGPFLSHRPVPRA